ncbi:hypothetical protein BKA67DRAFT_370747 [Truncatella angustata]|uniref:Secreted protein n=1 Tax=Truncatella angustata TaxID=152316 RepID=A0A9P8UF38_9PEZI|nr:uncharacterized protein BKA67DRAFT_370747 [Truncatella angustata]KAH6648715.1 hypothetical protein BKA67DRAFT_370747 [Truncatella angustata]
MILSLLLISVATIVRLHPYHQTDNFWIHCSFYLVPLVSSYLQAAQGSIGRDQWTACCDAEQMRFVISPTSLAPLICYTTH